jgi:hypothetical protein
VFIPASELISGEIKIDYLIKGIIETDTTGLLFGPPGSGKTFVALDMALSIATGEPWNGKQVTQGVVIYCCAEGRAGISRRIKAWCNENDKCNDDLTLLHISRKTIDFSQNNEKSIIGNILKISASFETQVSLVVIDTLARHMPCGLDENSTKDMNIIIHVIDSIRENLNNCVIMFVHHSGHNSTQRARGASAIKAAMDFEICCKPGELSFTKMKDAEEPEPIDFQLKKEVIGNDEEGSELSSAIVEYGIHFQRSTEADCSETVKNGIGLLALLCANAQLQINDKWAGKEKDWRNMFYDSQRESKPNAKQDTLKTAYNRMKKSLHGKGLITFQGENVILLREEHQQNINELIKLSKSVHGT